MAQQRKRKRLAAVPIVAIGVVVAVTALMATPASAATGDGAGTGVWRYPGSAPVIGSSTPCGFFPNMNYTGQDVGTYLSADGAAYAGPITLSLTVTQDFYGNPLGDYYPGSGCTGLPGGPIPIASGSSVGTVSAAGSSASVNCQYNSGTYSRVLNVARVQLQGSCTISTTVVVGGTTVSRTSTTATTEVRTHQTNVCEMRPQRPPDSCNDTNQFVAAV